MMISPESYISELKNISYAELLVIRDELITEIRSFEEKREEVHEASLKNPSQAAVYQCNLEYLTKLCELISKRYKNEHVINEHKEKGHYLFVIQSFLKAKGLRHSSSLTRQIRERQNGREYSLSEHIKGLVYSMLSNQTKWHRIEPQLVNICNLFHDFDAERIKTTPASNFSDALFAIKCGNISTKAQMESLNDNIAVLEKIEKDYGSIDAFITSAPAYDIVKKFSKAGSQYKLRMLGEALVWEYLRNVGIDGAKPDTHLRRFLGADRMGVGAASPASVNDVIMQVNMLADETGLAKIEIDNLIWSFCADGYGEICTFKPQCRDCPIRSYCKH